MIFIEALGIRIYVIPSLDLVVTRSGEQELDLLPSVLGRDVEGVVPGRPGAAGTHEFFRLLMAAVTDMPDEVRATIANSGPYDRAPEIGFDATHFLHPLDAPAGTYLSVPGRRRAATRSVARVSPTTGSSGMSVIFRAPSPASSAPRRDPTATDALQADGRRFPVIV